MTTEFFTDRDLGLRFPEILAAAGIVAHVHRDHFAPDCPDEQWLKAIGERGWVALTHDRRIRYKPNELASVMRNKVALLVIVGNAPLPELAANFVTTLPRVERFLAKHRPPFIAKVHRPAASPPTKPATRPGAVELWHPR